MDDVVQSAMKRWPEVPAVFGWLRLDARGQWHLIQRDAPGFDPLLHQRGEPITSPAMIDFIGRNYEGDREGRWFWQNGPQRVYVNLDAAPLILRVLESNQHANKHRLVTHTGYLIDQIIDPCVDDQGRIFLCSELGPGMIHDLDLAQLRLDALPGESAAPWLWQWDSEVHGKQQFPLLLIEDAPSHYGFESRPL
ncbi:MAG: DUF2946 family protein [Proteobacteria bacterium]|jgi:hypothetical protein|nr:DUF2946 family protein [Pseudomonadota bacterium]